MVRRSTLAVVAALVSSFGCGRTTPALVDLEPRASVDDGRGGGGRSDGGRSGGGVSGAVSQGGASTAGSAGTPGGVGGVATGGVATGGAGGTPPECSPRVERAFPEPGAVDITTTTSIELAVRCPELDLDELTLRATIRNRVVDGEVVRSDTGTLSFVPSRKLALATRYTIELRKNQQILFDWDFTTRDGVWHEPELVRELSGSQQLVALDVSGLGEGVVAFSEEDSANYTTVSARRFASGSPLSPEIEVVDPRRFSDAHDLHVAVDDAGKAVVAWTAYADGGDIGSYEILSALGTRGSAFGPAEIIQGPGHFWIQLQAMAAWPSGEKPLVWKDNPSSSGSRGRVGVLDAERSSASQTILHDAGAVDTVELALEDNGGLWVVWNAGSIFAMHRSPSRGWSNAETLGELVRGPIRIATSSAGVVLVAFNAGSSLADALVVRRGNPGGEWGEPKALSTETASATTRIQRHEVALDAFGDGLVLWLSLVYPELDQEFYEVRAQRHRIGTGWDDEHLTLELGTVGEGSLALDPQGNGFAVGVLGSRPRASRFLGEAGFGAPEELADAASSPPTLAVDDAGRGVALWRSGSSLWLARFDEPTAERAP